MNGDIARHMLQKHMGLPTEFDCAARRMLYDESHDSAACLPKCPLCPHRFGPNHLSNCPSQTIGSMLSARYATHQQLQKEINAILWSLGITSYEGKSGGGPRVLDNTFTQNGTRSSAKRTDTLIDIGSRGVMTDFTVVKYIPFGDHANQLTAQSATHPDHLVTRAEEQKSDKYLADCNTAGYDFIPFAVSTGGRPGPGAIRLLRAIRKAAGSNCETWYFYNVLIPRVFTNLAVSQYDRDATALAELRARCAPAGPPADFTFPPAPADVARPFVATSTDLCADGWGPTSDGRYNFDPERCEDYVKFIREHEIFLRTHAPEFFTPPGSSSSCIAVAA